MAFDNKDELIIEKPPLQKKGAPVALIKAGSDLSNVAIRLWHVMMAKERSGDEKVISIEELRNMAAAFGQKQRREGYLEELRKMKIATGDGQEQFFTEVIFEKKQLRYTFSEEASEIVKSYKI